jgi:hypothetical protein
MWLLSKEGIVSAPAARRLGAGVRMEGDRRYAQGERIEGGKVEYADAGGPGKCKKGEPPVSAIVLMAEEAVEREQ